MSIFKTTWLLLLVSVSARAQQTTIPIEISDYGLLFTEINVNGKNLKAMVDFGDPHTLMLSGSAVKDLSIDTEKSDRIGYDINGNELEFFNGAVNELSVHGLKMKNVGFASSPGEMEGVSQQIGTRFDAALGWGFFGSQPFVLDYAKRQIVLLDPNAKPDAAGIEMPYDRSGSYMLVDADFGTKEGKLLVDTGAPVSSLHEGYLSDVATGTNSYGQPSQKVKTLLAQMPFTIEYELRDLSVLEPLKAVGILGGDLLQQYRISIYPNTARMYWKKVE